MPNILDVAADQIVTDFLGKMLDLPSIPPPPLPLTLEVPRYLVGPCDALLDERLDMAPEERRRVVQVVASRQEATQ